MTALEETTALVWPPVEALRDKTGRYRGTVIDGREKPWGVSRSRVTTIVGRLEDRTNIEKWVWQCIALGVVDPERHRILCEIVEIGDNKAIRNAMERIGEAGGSQDASARGRRYHALVGMALAGSTDYSDEVPPPTLEERRDIKAILHLLKEHLIEVVDLERIIVNKEMDYAGTFDYRLAVPHFDLTLCGDLKTGSRMDLSYLGYRAQLAAYVHGSHEVTDDGEVTDLTPFDRDVGLIIHLVPGTAHAELVGVDLIAGWRSFKLAHRVWSHGRGRPRPITMEQTIALKETIVRERDAERSRWVRARIDVLRQIKKGPGDRVNISAIAYLRSIWPEGVPPPSDAIGWNGDALGRVEAAVRITETDFEAPFPPNDPALLG